MFSSLFFIVGLAVGAFVGWSIPQPEWAKKLQAKAKATVAGWFNEL